MIPKIDPTFRNEICDAVREKAGSFSNSASNTIGERIRLNIERVMHLLGLGSESKVLCVLLLIFLVFPLSGIAIGLYRLSIWLLEFDATSISYRNEVPAWLAMNSTIVFGIVMFIFAFGISAKRHKASLFYPHDDDSLKHYVWTRTRAALLAVFAISLASYAFAAYKLDTVPANVFWAFGYAALQSSFLVAIAIIFARTIQPRFGDSAQNSIAFIIMLLFGVLIFGLLSGPEPSPDETLLLLCSPHVWTNTAVYFLGVTPHPIGWVLLVTIGLVIGKGIQSYLELLNMQPTKSLDGYQPTAVEETISESTNETEQSTEATVLKRIAAYDPRPNSKVEKIAAILLPQSKLEPRIFPDWTSGADSDRIKSAWERCGELILVMIVVALATCLAGAVLWWLVTAFYDQTQRSALLFCTAILLIPWLATLRLYGTHNSCVLYPVGVLSFSRTVCNKWLRSFCLALPILVLLNTAFCLRFDLNAMQSFWFVIRPVAFAVGLVPISIAMQFSFIGGRSDVRIAWLLVWAFFLFMALLSSLMMLTPSAQEFGANASVVSQIATGVWLATTIGFSITCLALQHLGNLDVPDESLRLRNSGKR